MSSPSADLRLRRWRDAARMRRAVVVAGFALPWLAALLALAWRLAAPWAFALVCLGLLAMAVFAWHHARRVEERWLARRLDARRADMEDSAALLFAVDASPLQALQRERLRRRIADAPPVDLRDAWPLRALAVSGGCALLALLAVLAWPAARTHHARPAGAAPPPTAEAVATPRLLSAREIDVLTLAAEGCDNDAIAARLSLSVRTVERHLQNVYAKLGLQGRSARTAAVAALLSRA